MVILPVIWEILYNEAQWNKIIKFADKQKGKHHSVLWPLFRIIMGAAMQNSIMNENQTAFLHYGYEIMYIHVIRNKKKMFEKWISFIISWLVFVIIQYYLWC